MLKILKLFIYDFKQGFAYNKVKFLILFIVGIIFSISFRMDAGEFTDIESFNYPEYVLYIVEGIRQLPLAEIDKYMIPVLWIGIQVIIGYIVGYYPVDDLHGYGQQILIRSRSRSRWWLSKCIWNVSMVVLAYIVLYLAIGIVCLVSGDGFSLSIQQSLIESGMMDTTSIKVSDLKLFVMLFIMPCLVSVAISMVQMVVALILSPVIGFIMAQVVMFGSTLFPYKLFIGNYSMFAKNEICGMTQIDTKEGIVINIMITVLAFVTGLLYFNKCNILSRE